MVDNVDRVLALTFCLPRYGNDDDDDDDDDNDDEDNDDGGDDDGDASK